MFGSMKLSIIMPVYNVEKYLSEAIESIICQDGDFELILVDDGSTDSSLSICYGYAVNDSRIRVIHIENGGVSNARNVGIAAAQGEYIQFIDSDDKLCEGSLEKIFQEISHGVDVILFSFQTFGKENQKVVMLDEYQGDFKKTITHIIESGAIVACWNKVFKKNIIKDTHFRVDLSYAEDYCFNLDVFLSVKSISILSEILYMYRREGGSLSYGYDENNFIVAELIRVKSIELLQQNGCNDLSCVSRNYAYNMTAIIRRLINQQSIGFLEKRNLLRKYCSLDYINSMNVYYSGIYAKLLKTKMYTIILFYLIFLNRNK